MSAVPRESSFEGWDPHGPRVGGLAIWDALALPAGPAGAARFRVCASCGRRLPAAEFLPNPSLHSGLGSYCSACRRERKREWRRQNPYKVQAQLERARAKPVKGICPECRGEFEGPANRVICGRRKCKDARYARLHPDKVREKERRKRERRKERGA